MSWFTMISTDDWPFSCFSLAMSRSPRSSEWLGVCVEGGTWLDGPEELLLRFVKGWRAACKAAERKSSSVSLAGGEVWLLDMTKAMLRNRCRAKDVKWKTRLVVCKLGQEQSVTRRGPLRRCSFGGTS